jgi:hypothetical protein
MSKQAFALFGTIIAAATAFAVLGVSNRRQAYAQPAVPQLAVSSSISMATVSTASIVDSGGDRPDAESAMMVSATLAYIPVKSEDEP